MKGILNRGINRIELVNNIRENGEGIEINKNYINKLKKEVSYEEALMFLCMSTVEIYGLENEIERLNNIIKEVRELRNKISNLYYEEGFELDTPTSLKYIDEILDKGE